MRVIDALRPAILGAVAAVGVAAAVVATSPPASAKSAYESAYGFDRTWNAGLRLVRVDLGLKITEKDDAIGYLMFDYKSPESPRAVPGSMEFIRGRDGDVRVVVQIPQMPGYHEQVMIDQLARKLRHEYGDPPRKPPPPAPPKDAGDDADAP